MFNFNSGGCLTTRVERTGESTAYNWNGGDLTSIVDQFGRTIPLVYSGGLLSSIQDFAGNTWTFAHTGTELTSVTAPNPGGGSPGGQAGRLHHNADFGMGSKRSVSATFRGLAPTAKTPPSLRD